MLTEIIFKNPPLNDEADLSRLLDDAPEDGADVPEVDPLVPAVVPAAAAVVVVVASVKDVEEVD